MSNLNSFCLLTLGMNNQGWETKGTGFNQPRFKNFNLKFNFYLINNTKENANSTAQKCNMILSNCKF